MSLRLDTVQRELATIVANEVGAILETPIHAGSLRISNIDEIGISDIALLSPQGDTIIIAENITAHISPFELFKNRIQINTLAIAAPDIRINRVSKEANLNIQYLIDKLRSSDNSDKNFSLQINQLLVYDGSFSYDILDSPVQYGTFDNSHIRIDKIRCNISLKKLLKEELDVLVRTIEGTEKSGLELKKLNARIEASIGNIRIKNLEARTPNSILVSDSIILRYDNNSSKALCLKGDIESKCLRLVDFAPLIPESIPEIPDMAFSITGFSDSTLSRATLQANTLDNNIALKAIANVKNIYDEDRVSNLYIRQLNISKQGVEYIESLFPGKQLELSRKIGDCSIYGEAEIIADRLNGDVTIETINGNVKADASIDSNGNFKTSVTGDGINISDIVGIKEPLSCSLQATAEGTYNGNRKNLRFESDITELQTNRYQFTPIKIDGVYDNTDNKLSTDISIDDPGIVARMNMKYAKENEDRFILSLDVDSVIPNAIGITEKSNKKYSFSFDGELNMHEKSISVINAKLQNFKLYDNSGIHTIKNLHFCDSRNAEQRLIMINSDFIKCSIIGEFDYTTIANSFYNLLATHTPSLALSPKTSGLKNNYIFKCELTDSRFLSHMFDLPAVIKEPSFIEGACNDEKSILTINGKINKLSFKKGALNAIEINGASDKEHLAINAKVIIPPKQKENSTIGNEMEIKMNSTFFNDTVKNSFYWSNNREKKKTEGTLRFESVLDRDSCNRLAMNVAMLPDSIIHKDSIWYISGGSITGNTEKLSISSIHLYNDSQFLHINGDIGKNDDDILYAKASNLEVSTILDLVRFKTLQFSGNATGHAEVSSLMSAPDVNGNFNVDRLKINNEHIGRTDLNIGWDNENKSIFLNADIFNDNNRKSTVNGLLSQANDTIHIDIDADEINAAFIEKFTKSFITDIEGTANGNVSILGRWKTVDMTGAVSLNCGARLVHTNVRYDFHGDTLHLSRGRLSFNEAMLTDKRGNKGWLSGEVRHKNLGQWECDLSARIENLLAYDTNNFDELPLYGTVYATGNVNLKTNDNDIFLRAEVSNNSNSRIVYNSSDLGGVSDNSFVTFIDSSKKQTSNTVLYNNSKAQNRTDSRLNLDFMLDINESMQVKVYTNLKSDDYIDLYGKGPINAVYDNKEGFSMKGNLDLDRGAYKINIQNIFTKEFDIIKGSTLHFNGDPYEATLDIKAKYHVPSASLSALNRENASRKSVKVNCLLNMTGTLESPILTFDLELPEGSEEEKEMLASATSTPEQKNMQFIYLLSLGNFYTYDFNNQIETESQNSTAMESLISNTLSGQLNNMLGQIIDNKNWNISGNISTSERGWNSMEVEGMLEGRLLNDRLLINGNFGYRENPIANRNFIGDFELQWLLNKKGTISLRAYSKTNDRYFSKTNLTTQGAGIILRHDFNRWIWWKKDKKKKMEKEKKKK